MAKDSRDEHLKELFQRAADLVEDLPAQLQGSAFTIAVQELRTGEPPPTSRKSTRARRSAPRQASRSSHDESSPNRAALLEHKLNRVNYPGVGAAGDVLTRSLHVLRAARDDADIDGLTPGEIAQVLSGKFRVRTSAGAVRMALGRAGDLVDRVPEGSGYLYRLMQPGEDRLDGSS